MTASAFASHTERSAAIAIFFSGVLWGLWWIPLRWLARHGIAGDWTSVVLYGVAGVLMVPLAVARFRARRGEALGYTLAGAFASGAAIAMTNTALLNGNVVRVLLLFYLAPIWATLMDVLVLKERLGPRRIATVVLGLSGAAVVLGGGVTVPLPRALGEWMGLTAGFAFAAGSLFVRKAETAKAASDPVIQSFVSLAVGCGFGILFLGVFPSPPLVIARLWTAAPAALAIAAVWVLPLMWLFLWGAARLAPGRVTILMLIEPVAAVTSAALLLDEPFGAREIAGCVLIVAAGLTEALPRSNPAR
ncbi:MAG TPA: DMT family transporter [Alphaproteobacteria bacterium]|nr:DMT family transporter [Alphaproteobacteria bacterium]